MSDVAVQSPGAPTVAAPKKSAAASKKTAAKKPATKPAHPSVAEMVNTALATLKERKGTSLQAIKKYVAGNFVCDIDRLAPHIKKYLKSAVEKNTIIQTKGTGASGRFKLGEAGKKKKAAPKKPVAAKKAAPKKSTGEKKAVAAKPKLTEKKEKAAKKPSPAEKKAKAPKSPSKAKKGGIKSPVAAKPKTPKPKKAVSTKAKPAKK